MLGPHQRGGQMQEGTCRVVPGTQTPEMESGRAETGKQPPTHTWWVCHLPASLEDHSFILLIKRVWPKIPIKTSRAASTCSPAPHGGLFRDQDRKRERHGHRAHPLSSTTAHPSAGDCRPSSWSLHTARHGRRPQLGAGTAPKWGRFQPPPFPASRPLVLKQHNRTGVRTSGRK